MTTTTRKKPAKSIRRTTARMAQNPIVKSDSSPVSSHVTRVFKQSLRQWKTDEIPTSFMRDRIMHPAYQRIIGLGPAALPLIFQALAKESDPWFWALEAITGENPIPKSDHGRMHAMVEAWLQWGRKHGYLP